MRARVSPLEVLPREAGKARCAGLTDRRRTLRGRASSPEGLLSFLPALVPDDQLDLGLDVQENDHAID